MKANKQWFFPVCNAAFRGTLEIFADIEVRHRERMEVGGPLIYVCNHLSTLDPPIVASVLPRRSLFLAKRELFSNPLFSFLLRGWGAFPVSRYSADLRALRWARSMLEDGRAVVMFPEGTRSRNMEGMKKGQIGTSLVATQTGATIVPISIEGTDNMQNVLKVLAPIADIKISVGEPFRVAENLESRAALERATTEMMSRLATQLPPERRGVYGDQIPENYELTSPVESLPSLKNSSPSRESQNENVSNLSEIGRKQT